MAMPLPLPRPRKRAKCEHSLVFISSTPDCQIPGAADVVRWCENCGGLVIDKDIDGRTYPGRIAPMIFPKNTKGNTQ